jgi:hypothetical protein
VAGPQTPQSSLSRRRKDSIPHGRDRPGLPPSRSQWSAIPRSPVSRSGRLDPMGVTVIRPGGGVGTMRGVPQSGPAVGRVRPVSFPVLPLGPAAGARTGWAHRTGRSVRRSGRWLVGSQARRTGLCALGSPTPWIGVPPLACRAGIVTVCPMRLWAVHGVELSLGASRDRSGSMRAWAAAGREHGNRRALICCEWWPAVVGICEWHGTRTGQA